VKLLLDTHVFLWYISDDARLPVTFRDAIRAPSNGVFLSVAALWEAEIKHSLGKLPLPLPPAEYLPPRRAAHGIASLSIDEESLITLASLPLLHRDPFDRIMIAQSIQHGLTIATVDQVIRAYPVPLLPVQ
jgi:PIN domain nuclease of toxin-antitoxin system